MANFAVFPLVKRSSLFAAPFGREGLHGNSDILLALHRGFINPPDEARSSCYWWWFNGLINKEGITRDLEEFRAKGMGSVFLVNSAGGLGGVQMPQGVRFLSPEWRELYRFAL